MTVAAPQPALPSAYSASRLAPATSEEFRNELTACLALVAPVGMTEEARAEWLAVAWETLKHLPADLLHHGAERARMTCDHPSKIVPAIVAETADWLESRRNVARGHVQPVPQIEDHFERCTPEQAREILEQYGLRSRFPSNREASLERNERRGGG